MTVPNLEYAGEVREGNAKSVRQLETAQMAAAKEVLGRSSTKNDNTMKSRSGNVPT